MDGGSNGPYFLKPKPRKKEGDLGHRAIAPEISFQVEMVQANIGFNDNLDLRISIKNIDELGAELPTKLKLEINSREFYSERYFTRQLKTPLNCNGKFTFTVSLSYKEGKKIEDLPHFLAFQLFIRKQGNCPPFRCKTEGFYLDLNRMTNNLKNWPIIGEPSNIMVFGELGCGKSSLINALHELVNPSAVNAGSICPVLSLENQHVTRSTRKYSFGNFSLVDTVAFTENTYNSGELLALVNGELPDNFDIIRNKALVQPSSLGMKRESVIHSVIFCVDVNSNQNTNKKLKRLKEAVDLLVTSMCLNVVLVVTKIDNRKKKPKKLKKGNILQFFRSQFPGATKVYLLSNTNSSTDPHNESKKHLTLYNILQTSLELSDQKKKNNANTPTAVPISSTIFSAASSSTASSSPCSSTSEQKGTVGNDSKDVYLKPKEGDISFFVLIDPGVELNSLPLSVFRALVVDQLDYFQSINFSFFSSAGGLISSKVEERIPLQKCFTKGDSEYVILYQQNN